MVFFYYICREFHRDRQIGSRVSLFSWGPRRFVVSLFQAFFFRVTKECLVAVNENDENAQNAVLVLGYLDGLVRPGHLAT